MKREINAKPYSRVTILYIQDLYNDYMEYDPGKKIIFVTEEKYLNEIKKTLIEFELRNILNSKTKKLQEAIIGKALYGVTLDELDQLID